MGGGVVVRSRLEEDSEATARVMKVVDEAV